ncbi:Dyp-type peroxidase [Mycobacterium bohemicum]|uniref:Dyp-type peroxidase n=1 Tax=Mycobacterium bohemicum TaxID=56425 RepID=UPI000A16976B|nr:Dyp-type peroxidase [Mycobacterium bohemicum]MCV6972015.1 Dyp-type peroxidase [Mycobacterium bohemicum]
MMTDERGAPEEPVLDIDEIQGNIVPGFLKPHQGVLALTFGNLRGAKTWMRDLVPSVTTLAQCMDSRVKVREYRGLGVNRLSTLANPPPDVDDAWLNVAFSRAGLGKLLAGGAHAGDVAAFADQGFQAGLAARSALLGDPTDPSAEGNPARWLFGGPGREADVLLICGADRAEKGTELLDGVRDRALECGASVLYEETGSKIDAIGKEHFGFQDGISQPGVRGRLSSDPGSYVTNRIIDPSCVPDAWLYGLPGQDLVWPGEFVFGYPGSAGDPLTPGAVKLPGPSWSRNGSYLVFRRLRQDVAAFWTFAERFANGLSRRPGFSGVTADWVASRLMGRWPSGAPVSRLPSHDDPTLGADRLENNDFGFAADAVALPLTSGAGRGSWPTAQADPVGLTCPLASHIRKVNPREVSNDMGGRHASFDRRILRRALPFGPPLDSPHGDDPVTGNRGLLFGCYQTSIADQFEFLSSAWANSTKRPRSPGGFDMVIGQNGRPGARRARSAIIFGRHASPATVVTMTDFVVATGGGYFFTPSISALQQVIAR